MRKIILLLLLTTPYYLWSNNFIGWNKISTEHYTFIFEEFDEQTARELAGYGEEIYSLVTDFFDYRPKHIPVYINSRVDSPNGNFYPLPGSIVLYPVYPLNSENTTGSSSWLYEILLHEMVHFVQLEKPVGIFGGASRILGRDLASANGAFLPAWMVEGIAVYMESRYTDGGRGNNLYFQAYTKAAAWEDDYFSLNQLAYTSSFPPYNRIYSGGYLLTSYMMEQFGEDVIRRIYERYARFPFFGPFHAIKRETGRRLKDIYSDMKSAEREKYRSSFASASAYTSLPVGSGGEAIGDRIHPLATERGTLLYRRKQDSPSALVLVDEEGAEEVLVEAKLIEGSSFSADSSGETLIFSVPDYELYHSFGHSLISDLYQFHRGKTTRLTHNKSLFQPALSPLADRLIAVQRAGSHSRLVWVDRETGETKVLFERSGTNVMNPQFSPSGKELVFTLNERGNQDIWLLDVGAPGSAAPLLGQNSSMEYHPRFTDTGDISFISDRDGDLALYLLNRERQETTLIFKDPVAVADAYIKEGKIYYQSYRTKGYGFREASPSETPVDFSEGESLSPGGESSVPAVPLPQSRHHDLAIPYLWLPRPFVESTRSEGMLWGLGAAIFAGSVSQSTTWLFDFGYLPEPRQLSGSFNYTRKIGRTVLNYRISQSYGELMDNDSPFWNQRTEQTLQLSYPIFESSFLNRRHTLQNYVYAKHVYSVSARNIFSIMEGFSAAGGNYFYGGLGLSHNLYRINNAPSALFGGTGLSNRIDFSVLLPLLSAEETSFILRESGSASLSLSPRGTRWKTDWAAAWHNGGVASTAINARGWKAEKTPSDLSFHYSTSLQIPLALLDWGMPLGFNIQSLALAANLEGVSHVQLDGPSRHRFYGSLELIGTYGYNYGSTPFGAGVSVRFYNDGFGFNPSEDLAAYIFLSFNSLQGH